MCVGARLVVCCSSLSRRSFGSGAVDTPRAGQGYALRAQTIA
jgi:hypothetical protein